MSLQKNQKQQNGASRRYVVDPSQVDRIICHKRDPSGLPNWQGIRPTLFLVSWRELKSDPASTPLSWHTIDELASILDRVQTYVGNIKAEKNKRQNVNSAAIVAGQKRKYLHDSNQSHLPTPQSYSATSREQSVVSSSDSESRSSFVAPDEPRIYNGVFQRRQGVVFAVPKAGPDIKTENATMMPLKHMSEESLNTEMIDAEIAFRQRYLSTLHRLPGPPVTLVNDLDHETPSLGLKYISENVLGEGVEPVDRDIMVGCDQCKPNMGGNRGCEYTQKCGCLEYAQPDESAMNDEQKAQWQEEKYSYEPQVGDYPKKFPYFSTGPRTGCLVDFYLNHRHMIYECNDNCSCGPNCKNRNVQHGRRVRLEIFKTTNRGFGLRCPEPLRKGQFIDTYLGEVITDEEASRREESSDAHQDSYLFSLDKFKLRADGTEEIKQEDLYTVDGRFMGCPTRFINHCCDPNVRMYSVSYSKYDRKIYDLAFFAIEAIPAGTELTFDYMDQDDIEEKKRDPDASKVRCYCGADNCRGFLWS